MFTIHERNEMILDKLEFEEDFILVFTEEICRVMDLRGLSRKDLADSIGMTKSLLSKKLNGEKKLTIREVAAIAYELGCQEFKFELDPHSNDPIFDLPRKVIKKGKVVFDRG